MRRFFAPTTLFILSISATPLFAGGEYDFGGGRCASVGSWTSSALENTSRIRGILSAFKEGDKCYTPIKSILGHLDEIDTNALKDTKRDDRIKQVVELPYQMQALQTMVSAKTSMQDEIWHHLIDKSLIAAGMANGSSVSTRVSANGINDQENLKELLSGSRTAKESAEHLRNLIDRVSKFNDQGASSLIGLFNALPEFQTCVGPQTDVGTQIAGAVIGMAASFAAGGSATGRNVRNVITKFAEYVYQMRIAGILQEGNAKEYWNSMSCVIESTQQTFCATQDTQRMLNSMRDEETLREKEKARLKAEGKKSRERDGRNPLDGYYLLVNHVPEVSRWIQRVMFGSDPRMKLEADFQNRVINDVQGLVYAEKNVRGLIGSYRQSVEGAVDKKSAVLNLISRIETAMKVGGEGKEEINFIIRAIPELSLPYVIVGYEKNDLPSDAKMSTGGFISFEDWAQGAVADAKRPPGRGRSRSSDDDFDPTGEADTSIKWNPKFDDPDALLSTIETQVTKIFRDAQLDSIRYFTKMLIVDKPSIIIESIANPVRNVPEALRQINFYLANLKSYIENLSNDQLKIESKSGKLLGVSKGALIPFIEDTMVRIMAVLNAYEGLETFYTLNQDAFKNIQNLLESSSAYSLHVEKTKMIVAETIKALLQKVMAPGLQADAIRSKVHEEFEALTQKVESFKDYPKDMLELLKKELAAIERNLPIIETDPKQLETALNKEFATLESMVANSPQAAAVKAAEKVHARMLKTAAQIKALKVRTVENIGAILAEEFKATTDELSVSESPTNEIEAILSKRLSVITKMIATHLQKVDLVDEYLNKESGFLVKKLEASPPAIIAMEKFLYGVQDAAAKVVSTAYDRFNILLQRDTYLTTRLSTLVKLDYSLRIRNNQFDRMNEQERLLLLSSSRSLIEYFYGITSENPTKLQSDLARAQDINMTNLQNLELFFTPSLHALFREKIMIINGLRPTNADLNGAALADWREQHGFIPRNSFIGRTLEAADTWWNRLLGRNNIPNASPISPGESERYKLKQGVNNTRGTDDAEGSIERDLTLMCIQTLAFTNRDQFKPYCEGRILKSYYSDRKEKNKREELDVSFDHVLKYTPKDPKLMEPNDSYYTNGVCALRDFYRASDVRWMTVHLKAFSDFEDKDVLGGGK